MTSDLHNSSPATAGYHQVDYSSLDGWADGDHRPAFAAFLKSAAHLIGDRAAPSSAGEAPPVTIPPPAIIPKTRAHGIDGRNLASVARQALALAPALTGGDQGAVPDKNQARAFFERWFDPVRISANGFFTAYFEPEAPASRQQTPQFPVPLYRRPDDLAAVSDDNRPPDWDRSVAFAQTSRSGLTPYADRAAIEGGALAGRGLELAWLADLVTAYFIHIQGSARLRLADGTVMRIAYAAKSGHAYSSIGKRAVAQGFLHPDRCGKAELEAWISANPGAGRALMHANRSFIFFREIKGLAAGAGPIGAAGVDLTAGASLAVDRHWTTFHTPVWVTADHVPTDKMLNQAVDQTTAQTEDKSHFARLMIAQDTGSAIVGPARGD
ncbi:MAG: MltA domain-containing protein, partial [Alphaproteobacteria bacterium]